MASARSTVSIARTTPAQKPRGEHNITFNCGFSEGRADVMSRIRGSCNGQRRNGQDLVFCPYPCQDCARQKAKVNRNTINNGRPEPPEASPGSAGVPPASPPYPPPLR